jgi:hypothetical protein
MMIARYRTGQSYAELYAKYRFSRICRTVRPRRPDWVPTPAPAWRDDPGTEGTDGSVSYDCDTSDGPRIVSVYVHTTLNPRTGIWFAAPISILVTPDQAALAYAMVQHMIDTWQKNPRWVQYQNQMTQVGLDQVRANFQQFMDQMQAYHQQRTAAMNQQVASFEARQSAQAQQVSNFGENTYGCAKRLGPDDRQPVPGLQWAKSQLLHQRKRHEDKFKCLSGARLSSTHARATLTHYRTARRVRVYLPPVDSRPSASFATGLQGSNSSSNEHAMVAPETSCDP